MPSELTNAPVTFQRSDDNVLSGLNWRTRLLYWIKVTVFIKSFDAHLKDVPRVLGTIRKAGVSLNFMKCFFFTDSVKYLGHIIQNGVLALDEAHFETLSKLQHPHNVTKLRPFLGLCNLYGRFVAKYRDIAAPLTTLFQKRQRMNLPSLDDRESQIFGELIQNIFLKLVLSLSRLDILFVINTDARDY